ncbi:hypothetical protein KM043_010017 [Ampulex compressa]|nr:hypothetical protein KM043_010017 [Ampulex compressa]
MPLGVLDASERPSRVCCTNDGPPRAHRSGHEASEHPRLLSRARGDDGSNVGDDELPDISEHTSARWRIDFHQRRRDGITNNDDDGGSSGGGGATTMPYASCHLQCSAASSTRTSRDRLSRTVIGAR